LKMLSRLAFTSALISVAFAANLHDREYYEAKFVDWMTTHSLSPPTGGHFVHWLQNFANNDDLIESHNAKGESYKLGHNQFSHMTVEEWREYVKLGLAKKPVESEAPANIHQAPADLSSLAATVDWVTAGAVTGVKDQGQCGSCWSFSTTGALEGAYFNKYGTLKSYSEQHFVDCDTFRNGGSDLGCNGGLMDSAFSWAKKNGGVCLESDYAYVSGTTKKAGDCDKTKDSKKDGAVAPKSYTDVATMSDAALMSALNQQTVSVAIQADQAAFQLYKSGVFTAACGASLDHGVLAVGYGNMDGQDYYRVKNSWGSSWGDNGYIYFARGASMPKEGQCGILTGPPSYPNL